MKTIKAIVTLSLTFLLLSVAWAACPPGTKYECRQQPNGKQVCGCYYY